MGGKDGICEVETEGAVCRACRWPNIGSVIGKDLGERFVDANRPAMGLVYLSGS